MNESQQAQSSPTKSLPSKVHLDLNHSDYTLSGILLFGYAKLTEKVSPEGLPILESAYTPTTCKAYSNHVWFVEHTKKGLDIGSGYSIPKPVGILTDDTEYIYLILRPVYMDNFTLGIFREYIEANSMRELFGRAPKVVTMMNLIEDELIAAGQLKDKSVFIETQLNDTHIIAMPVWWFQNLNRLSFYLLALRVAFCNNNRNYADFLADKNKAFGPIAQRWHTVYHYYKHNYLLNGFPEANIKTCLYNEKGEPHPSNVVYSMVHNLGIVSTSLELKRKQTE